MFPVFQTLLYGDISKLLLGGFVFIPEALDAYCLQVVEAVRAAGGRTLIHCHQGVSRSGAMLLAYLMWAFRMTVSVSLEYARSKRGVVSPNPGFLAQLLEWQCELGLGTSTTVVPILPSPTALQSLAGKKYYPNHTSHCTWCQPPGTVPYGVTDDVPGMAVVWLVTVRVARGCSPFL